MTPICCTDVYSPLKTTNQFEDDALLKKNNSTLSNKFLIALKIFN